METKRGWFDGTINLPTILSVVAAASTASVFAVSTYDGIEHRVTVLEEQAKTAQDNRASVQNSLDKINDKLDRLNDRLIANSAGQQPGIQRWAK